VRVTARRRVRKGPSAGGPRPVVRDGPPAVAARRLRAWPHDEGGPRGRRLAPRREHRPEHRPDVEL